MDSESKRFRGVSSIFVVIGHLIVHSNWKIRRIGIEKLRLILDHSSLWAPPFGFSRSFLEPALETAGILPPLHYRPGLGWSFEQTVVGPADSR
jgi:hypothetical protein